MSDYYLKSLEEFEGLINSLTMPTKTRNQLLGWVQGVRANLGFLPAVEDIQRKKRIRSAAERIVCMSTSDNRTADELQQQAIQLIKQAIAKAPSTP